MFDRQGTKFIHFNNSFIQFNNRISRIQCPTQFSVFKKHFLALCFARDITNHCQPRLKNPPPECGVQSPCQGY